MTDTPGTWPVPEPEPHRIGMMTGIPHRPMFADHFIDALRFTFADAFESGLIDRPVELLVRKYNGQPQGPAHRSIEVFRELVEEQHVLGVAGPFTTDNCLPILPHVNSLGVPTVTLCGTQQWSGPAAFNLSNGGMADEPTVIGAWLKSEGMSRVGILKDAGHIGDEYVSYFRNAAQMNGLAVLLEVGVSPVATQERVTDAVGLLKDVRPDVVVYLGVGGAVTPKLNPAFEVHAWSPTRIMGTAFVSATVSPERNKMMDGWFGVDQYDERNTVLTELIDRHEAWSGQRPVPGSPLACGYDVGRSLALGLARMPIATPDGLRRGLETIRRLPAANGAPGTIVTFGPEDHRGYKGADYLIIRRARGGTTEFVATAPVA